MKWVKRILIGLGVLLVLAVGFVVVFFYVLHPKSRDAPNVTAPKTPEALARGEYLAKHVTGCLLCHSPVDYKIPGDHVEPAQYGAGRIFPSSEAFPGKLAAPNITSTHLGKWTDGEILRAMREGVDRDGKTLFPMMPYGRLNRLPDDDALAIIAYIRSLPAAPDLGKKTEVDFPVSMFIRMAPKPLEKSPPPWPTDPVERGKILLEVMSCIDCHTLMEKGKLVESRLFAGGNKFEEKALGTVYSSNITPDKATGIGAYSDEDLMRVFREGKGKDGRTLWVMPWRAYAGTKEEDLRAVIAALRTLKPITNTIPAPKVLIPVPPEAAPPARAAAGSGSAGSGSAAAGSAAPK